MSTDPATLRALLARVEQATGADREIDGDLELTFGGAPDDVPFSRDVAWTYRGNAEWVKPSPRSLGLDVVWKAPAYTASVDAALALVGRVMPDAFVTLDRYVVSDKSPESGIGDQWRTWIKLFDPETDMGRETFGGMRPTPALALLAALLRAKIAETEHEG